MNHGTITVTIDLITQLLVRDHEVDLVGTFADAMFHQSQNFVHAVVAPRKVDDGGDFDPGARQLLHGTADESWPHAHRGDGSVHAVSPCTQFHHVVLGAVLGQIREIDQPEHPRRDGRGHETKPLRLSGPNDVGSNPSIVNTARTPSGPQA